MDNEDKASYDSLGEDERQELNYYIWLVSRNEDIRKKEEENMLRSLRASIRRFPLTFMLLAFVAGVYLAPLRPGQARVESPRLDPPSFNQSSSTGYIWPARGEISSGFGERWGTMHRGIDIAADTGSPVIAAAAGRIDYAGWTDGGYGNLVDIIHDDGSMTRYGHLNVVYVQSGQRVGQGQQIGEVGSTGNSTGPHLHFELHPNGAAVNPMAYLPSK